MEAIKMTNFVSAMISIVLTQKVISSRPGHISSNFLNLEGVVFGTLSVIVGIYMIVNIYRVIHGKNHNSIIKKANMIMRKHSAKSNVIAVKYEDNGPNERILYLQVDELNESIEIAKAEIESKMHLEVRNIKCSEYL